MSWCGIKNQVNKANIEVWCKEVGIKYYTINSQGEIDVDGYVDLEGKNFKELPYKFGKVNGYFSLENCKNLISLKNCPNFIGDSFSCSYCPQLNSLEGCPKEIGQSFYCGGCKREFTEEEVMDLCSVRRSIYN